MSAIPDSITLNLPKDAIGGVLALSDSLTDRMHALLERNTDGGLSAVEKTELDTLVQIAQFGQLLTMAIMARLAARLSAWEASII